MASSTDSTDWGSCSLDDDKCCLLQFVNERKKPTHVGFLAWLECGKENNIADFVDKEIRTQWPQWPDKKDNYIKSAKITERNIKKKKPTWEPTVVKLISFGDYVTMCQRGENKKRFGVANPTKEQRRILCNKQSNNAENGAESSLDEDDESDDDEALANLKRKESVSGGTSKSIRKRSNADSGHKELKRPKVDLNVNKDVLHGIKKLQEEGGHDFVPSDNDSDDDLKGKSKSELWDIIKVKDMDLERLRTDNARLRALRCANEELGKIKLAARDALDEWRNFKRDIKKFADETLSEWREMKMMSSSSSKAFTAPQPPPSRKDLFQSKSLENNDYHFQSPPVSKLQKPVATTPINNLMVTSSPVISGCSGSGKFSNEVSNKSLVIGTQPDNDDSRLLEGINELPLEVPAAVVEQPEVTPAMADSNSEIMTFAGRDVLKEAITRIDVKSSIKTYTTNIMGVVFTPHELATCSMTGSTSNFQKGSAAEKKLLPPDIKNAVEEYIFKKFEKTSKNESDVKSAMKTKLNNECAKLKRGQLKVALANAQAILAAAQQEPAAANQAVVNAAAAPPPAGANGAPPQDGVAAAAGPAAAPTASAAAGPIATPAPTPEELALCKKLVDSQISHCAINHT